MSATSIIVQNSSSVKGEPRKKLTIPVRYLGYIRILIGVWLAVWAVMELFLAASLVRMPAASTSTLAGLGLLLACFTVAGAFMVWRLVWVNKGREILEWTPDRLLLHRKPAFGKSLEFERGGIRNLHIGSYAGRLIYPSWGRAFLGKEEYYVGFDYDGKPRELARGVRRSDAERVLALLRDSRS